MKIKLISPRHSLIDEIVPNLEMSERDYSSNLIVFPGKRPAHFLRKALAKKMQVSFIPPVIFSMDEFVDHLFEMKLPGRKLEGLDAVALLYDIHKKAVNPLGGASFMTPDGFFPLGLRIYRDLEELYIEAVDRQRVREIELYAEESIPEQTLHRLQSLSFFYEEFYENVRELGFSTRSMRYGAAAEMIDDFGAAGYKRMIFAGFFALTRCEKTMFKKLLSLDNTLLIFQDGKGMKEKIAELGVMPSQEEWEHHKAEVHFYSSPDTHGQVYALRSVLESKIKENGPFFENTAIVLPLSDTLFPLLRQGTDMIDEDSYNISLGYPLQRTPVFAFLNSIMELMSSMDDGRIYLPAYLNFVLHPYTKNIYFNDSAEITRIMFHAIEEGLIKYGTKTFVSLQDIEEDDKLFELVMGKLPGDYAGLTGESLSRHLKSIHENTISKFLSFENVGDFSLKCAELLTYIFNNSTAKLHPLFYPFSESFMRSLELISGSLMKEIAFAEQASYFTFFRKYLTTCYTPFEGTPLKGLQVLGFLETRNLKFDRVFILDANEEALPDTKKDDTLLPFKARKILGLPTYQDRDILAAHYFEALTQAADEVHLFFIENDKKERSRFVERLLWERQKNERTTDTKNYLKAVQYRIELKNSLPPDISKTGGIAGSLREFPYSASALDAYLRCQLQFYYSYVLRIDKKEEISGDIERQEIGRFVHHVLSQYFLKRKGFPLKEKDIDLRELHLLINRLFEKEYGENPGGAVYLLKQQIKKHLSDFFEKYFLPLIKAGPVTMLNCEEDIRTSKDSFNFRGRIDAVIKNGGKALIIDYKTGANADFLKIKFEKLDIDNRDSWSEAIGSIQLPFYLMLYSEHTGRNIKDLNAMFLLIGRSLINSEIELPLFTDDDGEEKYEILNALIFRLLKEITDPDIPFKATTDRKETCPDCSYKHICGMQWIVK